jgi:hypothetical protein
MTVGEPAEAMDELSGVCLENLGSVIFVDDKYEQRLLGSMEIAQGSPNISSALPRNRDRLLSHGLCCPL